MPAPEAELKYFPANKLQVACLLTCLLLAPGLQPSPAVEESQLALISRCPAVFLRRQKDPRIVLCQDKLGKEMVVHACLFMTDRQQIYLFSLGWLSPEQGESRTCTDELGQKLPMPGQNAKHLDKADWHEIKGFDFVSAGKINQALKEFNQAVETKHPRFYNNLGACLAADGQFDAARKQLDMAYKLKADFALPRANYAWLELACGNADKSLAYARQALQIDPDLRPARFAAIKALLSQGLVDGALKVSEDTVKHWPADVTALLLSGDTLSAAGDLKSARLRYEKALLLMPNNPQLLLKLAEVSQQLGDLDNALKRARQATVAAPDLAEGHLALGRYLEMNREGRASEIQFERALELDPPGSIKEAVYGPLLRVLVSMSKLEEADKASRKWLKADKDSSICHFNRAWVLAQLKGEGDKHMQEAIQEAIKEYRQALLLDGKLVSAHYNLALLLVRSGDNLAAARELNTFLEMAPAADPDAENARKLLAALPK